MRADNHQQRIQKELYGRANEIVGLVGRPTLTHKSVTNELYVKFCCLFGDGEEVDAAEAFLSWVKAYREYILMMVPEGGDVLNVGVAKEQQVAIYWRETPEVFYDGISNLWKLRARLLITKQKETLFTLAEREAGFQPLTRAKE